jgi:hypothetical protein
MDSAQNNTGFYQSNAFPPAFAPAFGNNSNSTWVPPIRRNSFFPVDPQQEAPTGLRSRPMPWDAIYPPPKPLVELVTFSPELIRSLHANPDEMMLLSPDQFEELVAELFAKMNYTVKRNGRVTASDGGIDIVAMPKAVGSPLIAIQVKHHEKNLATGVKPVRELLSLRNHFSLGYLVTNTRFTGPAKLCALHEVNKCFIRLRGGNDMQRWMGGVFGEEDVRELPASLTLPDGVCIDLSELRFNK